jgi:hypothetical protein
MDQDEWKERFIHALATGFLIPPTQNLPLILPSGLSDGETAALIKLLKSFGN